VDAAVSLIMLQNHGGRDGALRILRIAASSGNRRISELARDIVQGASLPAGQPGGG